MQVRAVLAMLNGQIDAAEFFVNDAKRARTDLIQAVQSGVLSPDTDLSSIPLVAPSTFHAERLALAAIQKEIELA